MTNREYEEIIRSAFGESETGHAGPAPVGDAKVVADEYASLRAGLKSLAGVPECQLTNERLRNAILGGGVKRRASNLWFVGPLVVGAAAMFAVVVMFTPKTVTGPASGSGVLGSASSQAGPGPVASNIDPGPSRAAIDSAASILEVAKAKETEAPDASAGSHVRAPRPRPRQGTRVAVAPKADSAAGTRAMLDSGDNRAPAMASVAGMGGAAPDAYTASPSVIVVEPGSDPVTGAQPAQEVKRGDVLFGG